MIAAGIGVGESLLVLGVIVLLFGAKRLPGLARAIGRTGRELRRGSRGDIDEDPDS